MNISKSIRINCTKEELWLWLTELEKLKKWNPKIITEEQISTGNPQKGFKSKVLIQEGKKEIWYDNEIIEYQPDELLIITLSGGYLGKYPMTVTYEIDGNDNQLELKYNSKWKPSGILLRLFYPLIKIKATQNTVELLNELKEQIEKQS